MEEARQYPVVMVHARRNRSRMDFSVEARFPMVSPERLARQMRQDLWRALQNLRGFSPVIELVETSEGLMARIGGQVDGRFPRAHCEAVTEGVIMRNRARWIRWAGCSEFSYENSYLPAAGAREFSYENSGGRHE